MDGQTMSDSVKNTNQLEKSILMGHYALPRERIGLDSVINVQYNA